MRPRPCGAVGRVHVGCGVWVSARAGVAQRATACILSLGLPQFRKPLTPPGKETRRATPLKRPLRSPRLLPIILAVRFRALPVLETCTLLALCGWSLERLVQPVLRETVHARGWAKALRGCISRAPCRQARRVGRWALFQPGHRARPAWRFASFTSGCCALVSTIYLVTQRAGRCQPARQAPAHSHGPALGPHWACAHQFRLARE